MMAGQLLSIVLAALLGLGVGSFLNVVVLRTYSRETLGGRSHCLHCGHQLAWHELVPVASYLWLRGRCLACGVVISAQYPLVEAGTTAVFVILAGYFFSEPLKLAIYLLYSAILVAIFVYDLKYYVIPDRFTLPAIVLAIVGGLLLGITWWNMMLGMVIGAGVFWLQFIISRGRWIGGGDIRLGALMGAMLGWQLVLIALFLAYMIGSFVALGLIVAKRKTFQDSLAFGTFLSVATVITLLMGEKLLHWYLYEIW